MTIKQPLSLLNRGLDNDEKFPYTYLLSNTHFFPIQFIASIIYETKLYLYESEILESSLNKKSNWVIQASQQKYHNYVLIIGESMRKDYMSLYGYTFKTTPFLDQVNGFIFENYIAAAPNTQASINRSLYHTNEQGNINYSNNIISLAKEANLKTYWLSNQYANGKHNTAAARLAKQTDYNFFNSDSKKFDIDLLPQLKKLLSKYETQPRLIVIHLMGSHNLFCDRLHHEIKLKLINKDMSCYLQSLQQTDDLIKEIHKELQQVDKPYSVIYFSDHGLSKNENFKEGMWVNNKYKQNYQIPFIRFDSDSTNRTIIHSPKSAFDFINGFAEWLGIEEKTLSQQPSFFEDKPNGKIRVFNWHEMVDFDSLEDDPPLPPTPYK